MTPGACVIVIGKSTTVGVAWLPTAIGAPTVIVTPAGPTTLMSPALTEAKFTGWLKATWRNVGA